MALSPQEFQKLQEQLQHKRSVGTQTAAMSNNSPSDFLGSAGKVVNSIFPGKQIGESLVKAGTNVANLVTGGRSKYEAGLKDNTVNVPALAGDYAQAGIMLAGSEIPVSKALGPYASSRMPGADSVPPKLAAKAAALGKNVLKGAGVGYAADVSQNLKEGESGADLNTYKPGLGTALGAAGGAIANAAVRYPSQSLGGVVNDAGDAVGKVTGNTVVGAGKTLKAAGEGAYGVTIIPEESTRIAMQGYSAKAPSFIQRVKGAVSSAEKPITEANTAARHGLSGTEKGLGVQAKRVADSLWSNIIQPKLANTQGKIKMEDFFSNVEKEIKTTSKEPSRRNSMLEALQSLKEDFAGTTHASLEDLQNFKEEWAKFIPEATYKGKPIASALKDVKNIAAGKARELIYKHAGSDIKQAYIDYGNLKSIMQAGIKSEGDPAKRSLGKNVWTAIMNNAVTPIATVGGKVLYKTGSGIELLGKGGAKRVKDVMDVPIMTDINVTDLSGGEKVNIKGPPRLALPSGKPGTNPIQMGGKNANLQNIDHAGNIIPTESQVRLEPARRGLPAQDPKTGRMKRVYTGSY